MKTRTATMSRTLCIAAAILLMAFGTVYAQEEKPASPVGNSSTQIGDGWVEVNYGRPILRNRNGIFGAGDEYGAKLNAGAPVWRAGANVTTRIKTDHALDINGTKVPAGEYSLFVELKEGAWTAIISKQPFMDSFDRAKVGEGVTWGAYGYNAEHDVVRAPMTVTTGEMSIDQLTFVFSNVTADGGELALAWDNQIGVLPFKVAK